MAAQKKGLGKSNARSRTKGTTGSAIRKPIREGASRIRKNLVAKMSVEGGAEQLRQAADLHVGLNSTKIAAALTKKAMAGDLASTKALVSLAEGKKPAPEEKKPGPSLAEWLASQPQWGETEETKGQERNSSSG